MHLDQIWQYPVKSLLGGRVPAATLAGNGIVGDRMFALRDEQRGAIASARRIAGLSRVAAQYEAGGGVTVTLPDGGTVAYGDGSAAERLSEAVAHPVTLWAKPDVSDTAHWAKGKPDSDDPLADVRAIMGRMPDEPLPDFSLFPPEIFEFEYPPGNYFDCWPLMIMTTSALRSLQSALPDSVIDERRFRPSLVIDTGDEPGHPEFAWSGRDLRIGAATVHIRSGCPRCVAVTREFGPELPADRAVLRHIVRDLDQNVGVYATVVSGGSISVGDVVELA